MSESWGRDLQPTVDGIFYDFFGFGTFFRYHNLENEIDAWESTVDCRLVGKTLLSVVQKVGRARARLFLQHPCHKPMAQNLLTL